MSSSNPNETAGAIKDAGRESRLSFRKFAEHQLRNEFKQEAMKKCDIQLSAFADCAKTEGLMVIFRCNEFKSAVDECLAAYMSNERWELYKKEHAADLESKVISSKN
eukprot:CAMPEP_0176001420 /NCGR_PEP_ID=MMETSP0120_2-20121206/113_1 /TAXON_ID=160619 /ORGANISM="Kryptoperidinium foliaceum, Strain CCMP 1326" /LENGTH=106 /DNA_ID=CAMNT_0017333959 /DNA_START=54 /DNA_END=374 /DNA_ORIENTATION=-